MIVDADGEWEAWIYSPSRGIVRYRSFIDLIRAAAFKSTKMPELDFLYDEEELINSCARHLAN